MKNRDISPRRSKHFREKVEAIIGLQASTSSAFICHAGFAGVEAKRIKPESQSTNLYP